MLKNRLRRANLPFVVVLIGFLLITSNLYSIALIKDTLRSKMLNEVEIRDETKNRQYPLPEQSRTCDEFVTLNAKSVADVAKYFSGVFVKDYGGIGGFKSVSLRGFGTQHTGVSYDGLILDNIQSGEVDLGRYDLDNIDQISINIAQPNNLFQCARSFASVGLLNINTKLPKATDDNRLSGNVALRIGSFGWINATVFLARNLTKRWACNFSLDTQTANGEYQFTEHYGNTNSQSEILTRKNTDVQSVRSEINLLCRLAENEKLILKSNIYLSNRALPGGIVWYNAYSNKRLYDRDFFTQAHYENRKSQKVNYQLLAKYSNTYSHYRDSSVVYQNGIDDEKYSGREYYISASTLCRFTDRLQIAASADAWYNDLIVESGTFFGQFTYPTRYSGLANIACKYIQKRFFLGGDLLYTATKEKTKFGQSATNLNKLTPTIIFSFDPIKNNTLKLRAFYKNIFRVPTFNELYYHNYGNPRLNPEMTHQFNIGITYSEQKMPFNSELNINIDGYYNKIDNKIVGFPRDPFHWTLTNKNKVQTIGMDANVQWTIPLRNNQILVLRNSFSLQKATDVTPESVNYGEQIPYAPVYFGSSSISYKFKSWNFGYNLQYSAQRWAGQNIETKRLDPYTVHSFTINYSLHKWRFNGEINNLFNAQYEIIKFYPMPEVNFKIAMIKTI